MNGAILLITIAIMLLILLIYFAPVIIAAVAPFLGTIISAINAFLLWAYTWATVAAYYLHSMH